MLKASLYHINIPLKRPFDHAKKQRNVADSILLRVEYNGVVGWGECAPRDYVTGNSSVQIFNELCKAKPQIFEVLHTRHCSEPFSFFDLLARMNRGLSLNARCILEMAILDWFGRYYKKPVFKLLEKSFFNPPVLQKEKFFKTSQVLDLSMSVEDFLDKRQPFHCIKIKVNSDMALATKRIQVVRESVGVDVPVILDANMSWSLEAAKENIKVLEKYNIAFYEEPLTKGALYDYGVLREKTGAKFLLDESLCSYEDAINAIKYKAVDAFNIRISKCGGLLSSIRLIELARKHSLGFQLGAQVAEVGPLIAASRHLRYIASDAFTYEAGQPDYLFENYIVDPMPLVDRNTNLALPLRDNGLGLTIPSIPTDLILNSAEFYEEKWGAACLV